MRTIQVTGTVLLDEEGDYSMHSDDDVLTWLFEVTEGVSLASEYWANRAPRSLRVAALALKDASA